ncbi:MAG TPA: acyl-CoA dehydrogenase family protein, partial [Geobacteraceae bacterium]|nr:acyl-CoA dehydrogenase family protein [Geobacteraceae bacterium]
KSSENTTTEFMSTLPGDDVRQIMWRFADRYELQMIVQSARSLARGVVARLVAEGARNTHEWTEKKAQLLSGFDEVGLTTVFMDPEDGGFLAGPKNLALALVAFELSWVDGGAATCSLASNLALSPIHEKGTPEQRHTYMSRCVPPLPGEDRKPWRGAFALTEPLPYVGVDTGILSGRMRIVEWEDGKEPVLQVEKRGRFITNMGFANFVTAAVDSDDPRIKGSAMVILEEGDPGSFDRGSTTLKLVHQLSSTSDPILSLRVPASRIIGGYSIKDGVIIPNISHGDVIESVFRRTRVPVSVMSSAKLLSAVEPVIRYQRTRFRGGSASSAGSPRYEQGLQQKEDALQRLVDVWASGEAGAALGFAAARMFDAFDPVEREKDRVLAERGITGARAQMKLFKELEKDALDYLAMERLPEAERDDARFRELADNTLVQFLITDALTNVFCPACKLWNTGYGATMMREAVSLMGGYGITEDCPGFLGQKWMDAQLEATYEGPEAVQRRQLSITMLNELFLAQFRQWIKDMRGIASRRPGTGACTLASAMELWLWTLDFLQKTKDADGKPLYHSSRHGVVFPFADALCWLLTSRQQILDLLELEEKGPENPVVAEGLTGFVNFFSDLCHVQAARTAGEVGRICAELVYGYNRHPDWCRDALENCFQGEQLDALECIMPGIADYGRAMGDAVEADGSHASKAGPCPHTSLQAFMVLRQRLDICLTGARLAKDRAAAAISKVMIPEALDYPA